MNTFNFLPALNLMTLVIVLVALALMLVLFLRRRSNRHPMRGVKEENIGARIDKIHADETGQTRR